MSIPNILCSLSALGFLVSAIALFIVALLLVRAAWTGNVSSSSSIIRSLMSGSSDIRLGAIVALVVLFVIASDSVVVNGYYRLGACAVLCSGYAGALVPALLVTLVSDPACIVKHNANSTLADLRSTARSAAFWGILVALAAAYVISI